MDSESQGDGKPFDFQEWADRLVKAVVDSLNTPAIDKGIPAAELRQIEQEFEEEIASQTAREAERWAKCSLEARFLRHQSDVAAARACRTRLLSIGLTSQLATIADPADPTPAPGLQGLGSEIQQLTGLATSEADRAGDVAGAIATGDDLGLSPEQLELDLLLHSASAIAAAREAERLTRTLAQLAMGVSSCSAGTTEVYALERAAVAVLYPPRRHGGRAVPLLRDGMTFAFTDLDDLAVELCGMVCRLLVDRGTYARLSVVGRPGDVAFDVTEDDDLVVSTTAPANEQHRALLAQVGWTEAPEGGRLVRSLPSPVTVLKPASLAARTLFSVLGLTSPDQLELSLLDRRAVLALRERYARMMSRDLALLADLAHGFEGEAEWCSSCQRGRLHPIHLCPRCSEIPLDPVGSCPRCHWGEPGADKGA